MSGETKEPIGPTVPEGETTSLKRSAEDSLEDNDQAKKQKVNCKFWPLGSCKFGARCTSYHDPAKAPVGGTVCKHYQSGACKFGDRCRDRHVGPSITTMMTIGPNGTLIPISVPAPPVYPGIPIRSSAFTMGTTAPKSAAGGARKSVCKFYQEGKCKNGDTCPFVHPAPGSVVSSISSMRSISGVDDSSVCVFYKRGECKFGDKCKSHHPGGLEGINRRPKLGNPNLAASSAASSAAQYAAAAAAYYGTSSSTAAAGASAYYANPATYPPTAGYPASTSPATYSPYTSAFPGYPPQPTQLTAQQQQQYAQYYGNAAP